jgi:hypothetical protein
MAVPPKENTPSGLFPFGRSLNWKCLAGREAGPSGPESRSLGI